MLSSSAQMLLRGVPLAHVLPAADACEPQDLSAYRRACAVTPSANNPAVTPPRVCARHRKAADGRRSAGGGNSGARLKHALPLLAVLLLGAVDVTTLADSAGRPTLKLKMSETLSADEIRMLQPSRTPSSPWTLSAVVREPAQPAAAGVSPAAARNPVREGSAEVSKP